MQWVSDLGVKDINKWAIDLWSLFYQRVSKDKDLNFGAPALQEVTYKASASAPQIWISIPPKMAWLLQTMM